MNTDSWVKSVQLRSSLAQDVAANQSPQPPSNPAYKTTSHTHAHTCHCVSRLNNHFAWYFLSHSLFSILSSPFQFHWKYVLCSLLQNTDTGCCFAYWQLWLGVILSWRMSSLNHLFQELTHSVLYFSYFSPSLPELNECCQLELLSPKKVETKKKRVEPVISSKWKICGGSWENTLERIIKVTESTQEDFLRITVYFLLHKL